jgi:hypothetical protein
MDSTGPAPGGTPVKLVHIPPGNPVPPEILAEFAEKLERLCGSRLRLLEPLPFRTVVTLNAKRAVDSAAIWLTEHGWHGAAERLWRLFGMLD